MIAVSECARNISCSGGIPVAITNCLNFGNPYNPEVYYQFVHALQGMGKACLKFDTPVTGGNVSFYNQTATKDGTEPVYPTPVIGMLGIMEDQSLFTSIDFKNEGDLIYILGHCNNHIGYSEYLNCIHGMQYAPVPYFDLDEEYKLHKALQAVIHKRLVCHAHDVSDGGVFANLLESSFSGKGLGFQIQIPANLRKDIFLFGESQGRALVSIKRESKEEFESVLHELNVESQFLGVVTGSEARIDNQSFGTLESLKNIFLKTIESYFN